MIVPVYNAEEYLNECVNSLLQQTVTDIEIILVDDGSTDNSSDICDDYAKMDNRVEVIHKSNGGLSSARNAGLEIAKGRYVGFIDSDDWVSQEMIEVLLRGFDRDNNIAVVSGRECWVRINGQNRPVNWSWIVNEERKWDGEELPLAIITEKIPIFAWGKLYKRDTVGSIRFREGRNSEDWRFLYELSLLLSESGGSLVEIPETVYYYRERESSIIKREESLFMDCLDNLEDVCAMNQTQQNSLLQRAVGNKYMVTLLIALDKSMSFSWSQQCVSNLWQRVERLNFRKTFSNAGKRHKIALVILKVLPLLWNFSTIRNFCLKNERWL